MTLHIATAQGDRPMTPAEEAEFLAQRAAWNGDAAAQWARVRAQRDALLRQTDFTQLPDAPANKLLWAAYRQELRDLTAQPDPFAIVWPVPPAAGVV